jgi:hypothetical protein
MHPSILERNLTAKQIVELEIFYSIEPFGEQAEWIRNAVQCCVIINKDRGPGQKRAQPRDFMPECYIQEKPEQSQDQMMQVLNHLQKKQEQQPKIKL